MRRVGLDGRDERPLDLGAGRVAAGVGDPVAVVAALAGQLQGAGGVAVELGAAGDQLGDLARALADQHPDGGLVAEPGAGHQGVLDVLLDGVALALDRRDAALGPRRGAGRDDVLGDHEHGAEAAALQRRGEPGDAGADDDDVDLLGPARRLRGQPAGEDGQPGERGQRSRGSPPGAGAGGGCWRAASGTMAPMVPHPPSFLDAWVSAADGARRVLGRRGPLSALPDRVDAGSRARRRRRRPARRPPGGGPRWWSWGPGRARCCGACAPSGPTSRWSASTCADGPPGWRGPSAGCGDRWDVRGDRWAGGAVPALLARRAADPRARRGVAGRPALPRRRPRRAPAG